eukprot:jgi/Botrbrau1/241/Bobra.0022s0216.1
MEEKVSVGATLKQGNLAELLDDLPGLGEGRLSTFVHQHDKGIPGGGISLVNSDSRFSDILDSAKSFSILPPKRPCLEESITMGYGLWLDSRQEPTAEEQQLEARQRRLHGERPHLFVGLPPRFKAADCVSLPHNMDLGPYAVVRSSLRYSCEAREAGCEGAPFSACLTSCYDNSDFAL